MRKLCVVGLVFVLLTAFGLSNALAGQPAAKATAKCGDVSGVPVGSDYTTVFEQWIKTPNYKDAQIVVAFECGITTNTAVMSRQLQRAIAEAEASVMVRVVIDEDYENPVQPGEITYASRKQTLIAEFAGDFSDCMSVELDGDGNPTGVVLVDDTCTEGEFLELILKTMNANSFSFVEADLSPGVHRIEVQAKLVYNDPDDNMAEIPFDSPVLSGGEDDTWTKAASYAWLGKGTVTVEIVRMIKDEDVVLELDDGNGGF